MVSIICHLVVKFILNVKILSKKLQKNCSLLKPEGEVRLKNAYIIKCEKVIKDEQGNIVELHCSYDPDSKTGGKTAGRKIKGTIHWVNVDTALEC